MDYPCRIKDLFPVDLGIDLKALQPEILQCKQRFQKDLWNTICNKVLSDQKNSGGGGGGRGGGGGGSGSKEKSEEKGEESGGGGEESAAPEEEPKPEESGENENNTLSWRNRSNSRRRFNLQQQQLQQRQPRRDFLSDRPQPRPPPQQQRQRQQQQHHQSRSMGGNHLRPEAFYLARQQLPLPRRFGFGGALGGGELSQFLRQIQPVEGVLDWRGASVGGIGMGVGGRAVRVGPTPPAGNANANANAIQVTSSGAARSFSATSRREILGYEDSNEFGASVDLSDGADAVVRSAAVASSSAAASQLLRNHSDAGYNSDGDSGTFYRSHRFGSEERATRSSDGATREFVPLMVGNWWACGQRAQQLD